MNKLILLGLLPIVLTACAGATQYIAAKEAGDRVAVEAFNDNLVTGIKDSVCALPYGTTVRHTEIQQCSKSLCGANSDASTLLPQVK